MKNMKRNIEVVLDRRITEEQFYKLKFGWKAFSENPELYKDSIVIDMVHQALDEYE